MQWSMSSGNEKSLTCYMMSGGSHLLMGVLVVGKGTFTILNFCFGRGA